MQTGSKRTIVHILLGIFIGLASRYAVDYTYNAMRKGGLTPKMPFVHTDRHGDPRRADVYIIPFVGFSEIAAAQFAQGLSQELGIVVKATGVMPLPSDAKDIQRDQVGAERLYAPVCTFSMTLRDTTPQTAYIAILADDMYPEYSAWNYCLVLNFTNRISIVATDRLLPYGIASKEASSRLYGERLYKLLKRTIGIQYYGYEHSSDPTSLLFSPIMGVDTVDQMSTDFRLPKRESGHASSKITEDGGL